MSACSGVRFYALFSMFVLLSVCMMQNPVNGRFFRVQCKSREHELKTRVEHTRQITVGKGGGACLELT